MTIYLDLDGVFADFSGAVQRHCPGVYYEIDSKKVWETLQTIPHFFGALKRLPNSRQIYDAVIGNDQNVEFLTALPRATGLLKTAQRDKTEWVHYYIDEWVQVNCVSSWQMKKHFCLGPCDILIDDSRRNIEDWMSVGGTGILHVSIEDTLMQLKRLGLT